MQSQVMRQELQAQLNAGLSVVKESLAFEKSIALVNKGLALTQKFLAEQDSLNKVEQQIKGEQLYFTKLAQTLLDTANYIYTLNQRLQLQLQGISKTIVTGSEVEELKSEAVKIKGETETASKAVDYAIDPSTVYPKEFKAFIVNLKDSINQNKENLDDEAINYLLGVCTETDTTLNELVRLVEQSNQLDGKAKAKKIVEVKQLQEEKLDNHTSKLVVAAGVFLTVAAMSLAVVFPPAGAAATAGVWAAFGADMGLNVVDLGLAGYDWLRVGKEEDDLNTKAAKFGESLQTNAKIDPEILALEQELRGQLAGFKVDEIELAENLVQAAAEKIEDANQHLSQEQAPATQGLELFALYNDLKVLRQELNRFASEEVVDAKELEQRFKVIEEKLAIANERVTEFPEIQQDLAGVLQNLTENVSTVGEKFNTYTQTKDKQQKQELKQEIKDINAKQLKNNSRMLLSGVAAALSIAGLALSVAFPPAGIAVGVGAIAAFAAGVSVNFGSFALSAFQAQRDCKRQEELKVEAERKQQELAHPEELHFGLHGEHKLSELVTVSSGQSEDGESLKQGSDNVLPQNNNKG